MGREQKDQSSFCGHMAHAEKGMQFESNWKTVFKRECFLGPEERGWRQRVPGEPLPTCSNNYSNNGSCLLTTSRGSGRLQPPSLLSSQPYVGYYLSVLCHRSRSKSQQDPNGALRADCRIPTEEN